MVRLLLYGGYFRPMKILYRIQAISKIRLALIQSLYDILSVLLVVLMVWMIFGVFGIALYRNQFGFCESKMNFYVSRARCLDEKRTWVEFKHNFDNITEAIPTLFVISSFDGWGEIMQITWNSQVDTIGPEPYNN